MSWIRFVRTCFLRFFSHGMNIIIKIAIVARGLVFSSNHRNHHAKPKMNYPKRANNHSIGMIKWPILEGLNKQHKQPLGVFDTSTPKQPVSNGSMFFVVISNQKSYVKVWSIPYMESNGRSTQRWSEVPLEFGLTNVPWKLMVGRWHVILKGFLCREHVSFRVCNSWLKCVGFTPPQN